MTMSMAEAERFTFSQFIAMKLATRKRTKQTKVTTTGLRLDAIRKFIMHLAGFSCLTVAGFSWNMTAGLIVAGLSCFALSWLTTSSSTNENIQSKDSRLRG